MKKIIKADIPHPPRLPMIGNLHQVDSTKIVQSITRIAKDFDGIFRLKLGSEEFIVLSSHEFVSEVSDEKRFEKQLHGPLKQLRKVALDGLFTAYTEEANWAKAHRILLPNFGPAALREMFASMLDVAEQMFLKWERVGDEVDLDVADNMTRLTLDTIALASFDYRFNSFYDKKMHPFVDAMVGALEDTGKRVRRPPFLNRMINLLSKKADNDIRLLNQAADELVSNRRKSGGKAPRRDLLEIMLHAKDPLTGETLDATNIRCQMLTFLIAGHETTSGLLSFAFHALLKNPHVLEKARAEVDRVLGGNVPVFEDIARLPYIDQVLKETLRLWPNAPAYAVRPLEEMTLIGGRYTVKREDVVLVLLPGLHCDPKIWIDPETFNPDRMAPDNLKLMPEHAWKPFGNGQRSCIGRAFSMQESILVLAMALQRFDLSLSNPGYELDVKETLTIKPHGLTIRAKKRSMPSTTQQSATSHSLPPSAQGVEKEKSTAALPLLILFGSNMGSSEDFAQKIANDGKIQGYVVTLGSLDDFVNRLPREGAVIIVTSSYEGQPPLNAREFVTWLDKGTAGSLAGVKFAVFGCGNKDWIRTYQAIPRKIDERLHAMGASRIYERGEADARGDFTGDFDRWYKGFWPQIAKTLGHELVEAVQEPNLTVEIVPSISIPLARAQGQGFVMGTVVALKELVDMSKPKARSKVHVEIQLPAGVSYRAGDYLSVMPHNPPETVQRALKRFRLDPSAQLVLHASSANSSSLPVNQPVSASLLFASYVELAQPATQKQIEILAEHVPCPPEKVKLLQLVANDQIFEQEVLKNRLSLLDILEDFQSCDVSLAMFLEMLPSLKPRQYSISSSSLAAKNRCTLTVAVVRGEAFSGRGKFQGVCSNFLAGVAVGDQIAIQAKQSQGGFHLPEDPKTPLILACAGTGIAPFRGFLQERALQKASGIEVGEALLFFGCDDPDIDFLYSQELKEYENQGVVRLRPAFSERPVKGCRYVQDRILDCREEVIAFYKQGAKGYVCGDGRAMAPAVRAAFSKIYQDFSQATDEEVESWFAALEKSLRYVSDVFS